MSIYTKTGDKGSTSLFDSVRVKKYSLRVDTYGTFDECTAQVSVAEKQVTTTELKPILTWIQEKLFILDAEIATSDNFAKLASKSSQITVADTKQLEDWIDYFLGKLPEIHQFILPGNCLGSAQLHVARTICRRGERRLIELAESENIRPELMQFVNRLSDCLYALARMEDFNYQEEVIINEIMKRYQARVAESNCFTDTNLTDLMTVFQTCIAEAQALKVPVSMTVVDQAGNLIGAYRMPNALLVSIDMSRKKAYTAVAMKASTADLGALTNPGGDFYQLETVSNGEIVSFAGGLPLYNQQEQLIGGIGVSGGTLTEDQAIATAGLACLSKLKSQK
ncbi:ATP:cob(I)alamin adenosyltransferase [Enterococcus sp. PF1-24]|uniref:cob(I)yrinic acid a,c-diamide adenosyltransferase n=1 Tax=unclassified Enterococcus TaxID=2608891 RepID=UPI002473A72D|nr:MULTISPECIES: cob(I)yrinic acid a,c-diamide adenosyltransferase [unclassified Enterococcus]MDH6365447.1 ATP:cob(I)alamin adenosyltransferase [Enterococcus sp. PFB1-1]MDH6402548.1 ATP:cob(I)alamin adenosyltransferase [Enterococcus sp. PF1-24]